MIVALLTLFKLVMEIHEIASKHHLVNQETLGILKLLTYRVVTFELTPQRGKQGLRGFRLLMPRFITVQLQPIICIYI